MNKDILSSSKTISQLDKSNVLGSINLLSKQVQHAWETGKQLDLTALAKNYKNIVISGMGGSALGGHVVKNLYKDTLAIPLEIVSDYSPPKYLSEESLVILSSYSGNTEEVLEFHDKIKFKTKNIVRNVIKYFISYSLLLD